jgi:hypothetical protein
MHNIALLRKRDVILLVTWRLWTNVLLLDLAPSPVAPCDDGPTRYAHAMMNQWLK